MKFPKKFYKILYKEIIFESGQWFAKLSQIVEENR